MTGPSLLSRLRGPKVLAVGFAGSGLLHLVAPKVYEGIVPHRLPRPRLLVYLSGVAELACASGLLIDATWAGPASAALLIAVWPANIQMAIDGTRAQQPLVRQVGVWLRVPMQVPMIRTALRSGRRQDRHS